MEKSGTVRSAAHSPARAARIRAARLGILRQILTAPASCTQIVIASESNHRLAQPPVGVFGQFRLFGHAVDYADTLTPTESGTIREVSGNLADFVQRSLSAFNASLSSRIKHSFCNCICATIVGPSFAVRRRKDRPSSRQQSAVFLFVGRALLACQAMCAAQLPM
jgi:hypothetical protein